MTAEQAKTVAQVMGQQLQNEWKTTYKVLASVPENGRDYRPDPKSRTAWELATHIAGADIWFLDGVLNKQFGPPADPPAKTVAELADWYKHQFPNRLERVLALEGPHLAEVVEFFGMKMPNAQYVIWCCTHMAHHRGQLAAYLRAAGGKVPSIYGGSADEPFQMPS
jgi:uncharacterized damage-inducible protein DinB